jgi:hypothetical protein
MPVGPENVPVAPTNLTGGVPAYLLVVPLTLPFILVVPPNWLAVDVKTGTFMHTVCAVQAFVFVSFGLVLAALLERLTLNPVIPGRPVVRGKPMVVPPRLPVVPRI